MSNKFKKKIVRSSSASGLSGDLGGISIGDSYPVRIMGVINLSVNSFFKGSVSATNSDTLQRALDMEAAGADVIDIGARSTAPYRSGDISTEREKILLITAIRTIRDRVRVPISVDTARFSPAKTVLEEGVKILNDPHGLNHKDGDALAKLAFEHGSSIILTGHEANRGKSADPISRVSRALVKSLKKASKAGVDPMKIILDPGIGFFSDEKISNVDWNCAVLASLEKLRILGRPILVGVSRKRLLGILTGGIPPEQRLSASLSATAVAVFNGAHVIRTHDVRETKEAVAIASAIRALKP